MIKRESPEDFTRSAGTSAVARAQRRGQDSPISAHNDLSESQEVSEGGRCEDAIQPTVQSMSQGKQARSDNSSPHRLVHEIHPHPHRRHFRHHLLDHFSGELNPDGSATAIISAVIGPDSTVDKGNAANPNQSPVAGGHERAIPQILQSKLAEEASFIVHDHRAVDAEQIQQIDIEESNQWPFFGTESRVLPSGRRVSFLKQACWGFSHSNSNKEKVNDQETIACQKTMKESKTLPRRSNLRRAEKTLDLRKSSPDGSHVVDIDKFKNESLKGPGGEIRQRPDTREILPCATIIDSSSTKGRHPIPKAPSIMRAVAGDKAKISRPTASRERVQPKKIGDIRRSPSTIATAISPSRRKSLTRKTLDKSKTAQSPQRKIVASSNIVAVRKEDLSTKPKRDDKITKSRLDNARKSATGTNQYTSNTKQTQQMNDFSPDSLEDKSSLVLVEGENESSTFEELSVDVSELSDRNLLVDYGDPSRFYFRNEWESRMLTFREEAASIRRKIEGTVGNDEVNVEALALIDNIEHMKEEMCELYDYFDQFEREEDTLLRQVQRQLNQANKYCRILHYRLQNAEKQKVDKNRIEELEEELKLSRQVAVSLHWELQTVDSKQLKLEKENLELRHRMVTVQTAKEALSQQATKLQNHIDQMSLHAPSPCIISESSEVCVSSDSTAEIKRQMQFMDEKEAVLIRRLVDMQKDRDGLKDELDKYQDLYGELPSAPAPGGTQQTDLKLRLKLAEDQSGVLARKLIEVQLENDNMVKLIAQKDSMAKEAMRRNPSVSDLQFLEDERESLRLALDEMEIENQKLAAELLRYKQAVHRQLHSSSTSADSPQDVGIVLRVPRSSESVFADDNSVFRSYESADERQQVERMMRPVSLISPSLSRSQLSLSRTLSDVGMPLSPDCQNQSVGLQMSPTAKVNATFGSRSSSAAYSRKRVCHKCRKSKWSKTIDIAVGTSSHRPTSLFLSEMRSIGVSTDGNLCVGGSYDADGSEVGRSIGGGKLETKEAIVQTISPIASTEKSITLSSVTSETAPLPKASPMPPHSLLLEEMRKQLAHVRTIAESMDSVVNVDAIDAAMELRGKAMLDAKSKSNCGVIQKQQLSKLAKSLQKYIRDMEISVTEDSDKSALLTHGHSHEIQKWNLHGHTDANAMTNRIEVDDSPTLNERSHSDRFDLISMSTVRSFQLKLRQRTSDHVGIKVLEATVLLIIMYILITSLPWSAKFKIFSLLLLFFVF